MDEITGVFIGEWQDGNLYAVLYGVGGSEYLARMGDASDGWEGWKVVSVKDGQGDERELNRPFDSPSPLSVAVTLMMNRLLKSDDEIVI